MKAARLTNNTFIENTHRRRNMNRRHGTAREHATYKLQKSISFGWHLERFRYDSDVRYNQIDFVRQETGSREMVHLQAMTI